MVLLVFESYLPKAIFSWSYILSWQLGLADKNILNYDFDVAASDPSDANTNSTTLFSDDTDDKSRKSANPEMCLSIHQEDEVNVVQRQNMVIKRY